MSDIIETRTSDTIATEINYIKRRVCDTVLRESVEIGRLLCEAKALVPNGEWMNWLKDNVDYSQATANNLMRLYEEYGEQSQIGFFEENRLEIFGSLTPSQAVALVALPYEQRKEFVETHDMSETSVRDIQAEIKARKEAEKRAEAAEKRAEDAERKAEKNEDEVIDLRRHLDELLSKDEKVEAVDIEKLQKETEDKLRAEYDVKIKEAEKAAAEKAKTKVENLQKKLDAKDGEHEKALAKAVEKAKEDAVKALEAEYSEKLAASRAEAEKLKKKLDSSSNEDIQKLSVHFELFQKEFQEVLKILGRLPKDNADKLKESIKGILDGCKKQL